MPSSATYEAEPIGPPMCILDGSLVPGSSTGSDWLIFLFLWGATPSAPSVLSLTPPFGTNVPMLSPMVGCEHPPLYLSGSGRASHETAISGSCQQALVGIHNSVWVWWLYMGWIPGWGSLWMVHPFVSAPNFVSVTPSVGILFPILRRNELFMHWSSS